MIFPKLDLSAVNLQNGPLYVEGAELGDTIVPLARLALLKEETPWRLVPYRPMTLWCSTILS